MSSVSPPRVELRPAPGGGAVLALSGSLDVATASAARSDFVRDVVHPGDGVAANARIEVYASELAGLLGPDPAGALTLQFRVVVPTAGAAGGGTEILLKTYSRRVPLSRRTAAAVVEAWNRGLGEIMGEFEADLKTALASRP